MALCKESVEIGRKILEEVNPNGARKFVEYTPCYGFDDEEKKEAEALNCIIGWYKVGDGFESLFTNVKDIEDWQLDKFNALKKRVPNSSICKEEKNGVTRLGWF